MVLIARNGCGPNTLPEVHVISKTFSPFRRCISPSSRIGASWMPSGHKHRWNAFRVVSNLTFIYSQGNRFKPKTIFDSDEVYKKWGVKPEKIIDMLNSNVDVVLLEFV